MGGRGLVGELNPEVLPDVVAAELDDRLACLLNRSAATASVGTDGESGAVGSAVSVGLFITDDLASPDLGAATPVDCTPAPRT